MTIEQAKKVLRIEAEAVYALVDRIDQRFDQAVQLILHCKGRVVLTGMGKSGLIGKKIAATLASTGTPALFLHPAEGIHGDLVSSVHHAGKVAPLSHDFQGYRQIGEASMVGGFE